MKLKFIPFLFFFYSSTKAQLKQDLFLKSYIAHHIGTLDKLSEVINKLPLQNESDFRLKRIINVKATLYNISSHDNQYSSFLDSIRIIIQKDSTACIINHLPDSALAISNILIGQKKIRVKINFRLKSFGNFSSWKISSVQMPSYKRKLCPESINPMNHEIGFSGLFGSMISSDSCTFASFFQNSLPDNDEMLLTWLIDQKIGVLQPFDKMTFWFSSNFYSKLRVNYYPDAKPISGWLIDSISYFD